MTSDQKNAAEYNSRPHISVIVLTMNRKEILARCLRSIRQQAFTDREIVVVDNASTDLTGDMIRAEFPDIRYFFLDKNMGTPAGRNYGVANAKGDICLFIDDDAYFTDAHTVERVSAYFHADEDLDLIAFRILTPDLGVEEYKSIPRADKKRINGDYECAYFCGAGFAIRRDRFVAAGMFWEPLFFISEELDASYRLLDRGCKMMRFASLSVVHDETPQARVPGKGIYFGVRSRTWIPVRNLPWRYAVSHIFLWLGYHLCTAVKNRHPVFFIRGVVDAVAGMPEALRTRRCISGTTLARVKDLSGRTYY